MFEGKKIFSKKNKHFQFFRGSKTLFLNSFLHFFKNIGLFRGKIVQKNIFPGGITKIGKNRQNKKGQARFTIKLVKNGKKGGIVLSKTPVLINQFLHFFKKRELFRRKIVQINIFPGGIKKLTKTAPPQKKGSGIFCQKMGKKRVLF